MNHKEDFWLLNHGNTWRGTLVIYRDGAVKTVYSRPPNRGRLCCWRPASEMPEWAVREDGVAVCTTP